MKENQIQLEKSNELLQEQLVSIPAQLQTRCLALEKQLSEIPSSLVVAGAQLRVMEAKMLEHQEKFQVLETKEQHKSAQIHRYEINEKFSFSCRELEAFMRKHSVEKQQLLKRISDQAETIHQLTHHVHLLHSKNETEILDPEMNKHSKFGGSFPVFFKEESSFTRSTEHDQKNRTNQPETLTKGDGLNHSYISKPWPLSDSLSPRNNSHQTDFVSRMTEGISQNSSSYVLNQLELVPGDLHDKIPRQYTTPSEHPVERVSKVETATTVQVLISLLDSAYSNLDPICTRKEYNEIYCIKDSTSMGLC
jgi:hypothetical protein